MRGVLGEAGGGVPDSARYELDDEELMRRVLMHKYIDTANADYTH
jgi:hypothetical protein